MISATILGAAEPYTIYPIPHKQVMNPGTASFSQRVFIYLTTVRLSCILV